MNRILKFRIWDKELKFHLLLDDLDFVLNNYGLYKRKTVDWQDDKYKNVSDKYILEQFTGLKDKDGKDSYDGDRIITVNFGEVVIEWNDNTACFGFYYYSICNKSLKCWIPLYKIMEFEVIGHVHEEK